MFGHPLTPAEHRVWSAAETAACVKDIARRLDRSPGYIAKALWCCRQKLGVAPRERWRRDVLTARQREAFDLIGAGVSVRDAALRLGASRQDVSTLLRNARRRMGIAVPPGVDYRQRLQAATRAAWQAERQ